MANARIVYRNLADEGTVTASSAVTSAPASLLQNVHRNRRWSGRNGDTEWILLTWPVAQSLDVVSLFGCAGLFDDTLKTLTAATVARVRVSSVDLTGVAGDLYDSNIAGLGSGAVKEEYGALVALMPAPVSARAVRIDLSHAGADAILAGRLWAGLGNTFAVNFSYGWSFGYGDQSRRKKSDGGQTFVYRDEKYRVLRLQFGSLKDTDRYGFVHEADRLNGLSDDVLIILDPTSTDLTRDTVAGLVTDLSPPTKPNRSFFAKLLSIEERL